MKFGAPFIMAKSASTQLPCTLISRAYTLYFTVTRAAPPVSIRQRFFRDFDHWRGAPAAVRASKASTLRAYSRTR